MLEQNKPQFSRVSEEAISFAPPTSRPPIINKLNSVDRIQNVEMTDPEISTFDSGVDSRPIRPAESDVLITGDSKYRTVLQLLIRAMQSAIDHQRDPWDFSIEITELTNLGIGKHLLRVMVCQGVIAHKRETTVTGQNNRSFDPEQDVVLSERSCFVISDMGLSQFESTVTRKEQLMQKPHYKRNKGAVDGSTDLVPVWDTKRRELRFGNVIVKRFKWPAANQEQVLQAFQEEGWPAKIDDPLPPDPSICPKRRLHDTIKCLNRRQINGAIKFRGDGTGQGVLLEICVRQKKKSSVQSKK